MKKQILLLVSAAASLLLGFSAEAATISYNGQIEVVHPGIPNSSRGTVDYIWFRVSSASYVSGKTCALGPSDLSWGLINANIASHAIGVEMLAPNPPFAFGDSGECRSGGLILLPGEYVFIVSGDSSDWGPSDGVVPVESDFTSLPAGYSIEWTSNELGLESIWAGNLNGSFTVTIPEPALGGLVGLGALLFGVRRRREWLVTLIPCILCIGAARAEQITSDDLEAHNGIVEWTTVNGMGYRLERTTDAQTGNWLPLSARFYGTGQRLSHHAYDLPAYEAAVGAPTAPADFARMELMNVMAYGDGTALVTAYDLRTQEGVTGSPLLSGFANPVGAASSTALLKTKRRIQHLPASIQNLTMASSVPPELS